MEEMKELNSDETVTQKSSDVDTNYSVFNALSLMSPTLGDCYTEDGYNPFPEGYEINEQDVSDILATKKFCKKIEVSPEFVDMGINKSRENFKLALENTKLLKNEMIKKSINSDILSKKRCDKVIMYLKNRQALLEKFLSRINKNSNILEMLQELDDLDPRLAEMIKSTFYNNFNLKVALDNLILFIMKAMEAEPTVEKQKTKANEQEKAISIEQEILPQHKEPTVNVTQHVEKILEAVPDGKVAEKVSVKKLEKHLDKRLQEIHRDREELQVDEIDARLNKIKKTITKDKKALKNHTSDDELSL